MYGSSRLSSLRCDWNACQIWPRRSFFPALAAVLAAFFSSLESFGLLEVVLAMT